MTQPILPLHTPRRGFLGRAAAAMLGIVAVPSAARTLAGVGEASSADEAWLHGLTGKHKQFFDAASGRDGRSLSRAMNFLDAYSEAYGTTDADTNVIFGAHGGALPLVMNDGLWAKYEFGKRFSEDDPLTRAPAVRNPYARDPAFSVARLQKRGVRFIVCLRSIRRLGGELAAERGASADEIRLELIANVLPAVTPVPAMIVAANRAQEAGLTYVFVG
ncbi:MAG: hypothetical protein WD825_01070 [Gemmatimonadaceae bacterium]